MEIGLDQPVPESLSILLIADPKQVYTSQELAHLDAYIARGET